MSEKQTHVVEVIWENMMEGPTGSAERRVALKIEEAYARLNQVSLKTNMVILGTFQQVALSGSLLCIVITCQWVNRVELQEAQMREAIKGSMPIGGRG